jgi:hypothetical protein
MLIHEQESCKEGTTIKFNNIETFNYAQPASIQILPTHYPQPYRHFEFISLDITNKSYVVP